MAVHPRVVSPSQPPFLTLSFCCLSGNDRSLSSSMSDLPSPANSPDCSCGMDFGEGMKDIYDALHPDVDEETVPTHLYPVGFLAKGFDSRHSSDSSARLVM